MAEAKKESETKRKGHPELLCLDFGHANVKAVRLRRGREQVTVTAVDTLDALPLEDAASSSPSRLNLGTALRAKYAALAFAPRGMVVRMLNLPGHGEPNVSVDQQIAKQFALGDGYRIGHVALGTPTARGPMRLAAVAVPEGEAQAVLKHFAVGAPAPHSLECSGLTALTAFLHGPGADRPDETACLVEAGARTVFMFFVNKGNVVLLRRYELGAEHLLTRLGEDLGVDRDMALSILSEGAIDVAALVHDVMGPVFKQFPISRDFVERHEKSGRVGRVWLSGGLALSGIWRQQLKEVTGVPVEMLNPFAKLTVADGAIPEALAGQEARFAAAVGAGLGAWYAS